MCPSMEWRARRLFSSFRRFSLLFAFTRPYLSGVMDLFLLLTAIPLMVDSALIPMLLGFVSYAFEGRHKSP